MKVVLALTVGSLALVSAAQARPDMYPGAQQLGPATAGTTHGVSTSLYQRLPVEDQAALAGTGSVGGYAPPAAVAPKQQPASSASDFDWGAAGIGAGFAVVLSLAIVGVAIVTRRGGLAQA